jgi:hypothetical protein
LFEVGVGVYRTVQALAKRAKKHLGLDVVPGRSGIKSSIGVQLQLFALEKNQRLAN